jgi:hypothetical protein
MPKKRKRRVSAEKRMRDLQRRSLLPVQDLRDLRQPRISPRPPSDQKLETFTTYGAYQDPI